MLTDLAAMLAALVLCSLPMALYVKIRFAEIEKEQQC